MDMEYFKNLLPGDFFSISERPGIFMKLGSVYSLDIDNYYNNYNCADLLTGTLCYFDDGRYVKRLILNVSVIEGDKV